MNLLPMETVFEQEKIRTRVSGAVLMQQGFFAPLSGSSFSGYEIHMGRTQHTISAFADVGKRDKSAVYDGGVCKNILGSYVHGLFDEGDFAERLVGLLLENKGITDQTKRTESFAQYKERQYNLLAEALRRMSTCRRFMPCWKEVFSILTAARYKMLMQSMQIF